MYDVLLVLFIHSGFLPETVGRNTWTVYKTWNMLLICFFHLLFEFYFFSESQRAAKTLLGLPAEGGCWHQAPKSWGSRVPPWDSGSELQLGHLPFVWSDTEGNQVFFWGVASCLLRNGSLLSRSLFCTSCSYCRGRSADMRPCSLGWEVSWAPWWACRRRAARGGQAGPVCRPRSYVPLPAACRLPQPGCGEAASLEHPLGVPVTSSTCGRLICTWSCDNTNVVFSLFYKSSEMFAKWVLFFVIPLSLLKGEYVFLWEEQEENRNVNSVKQKTSSLINI